MRLRTPAHFTHHASRITFSRPGSGAPGRSLTLARTLGKLNSADFQRKPKAPLLAASAAQVADPPSVGAPLKMMTSVAGQRCLIAGSKRSPLASGRFHVQEHHVRLFIVQGLVQRRAAVRLGDMVVSLENGLEEFAHALLIIDDEDLCPSRPAGKNLRWRRPLDLNPVGLDLVVEGLPPDAEAFGGFELVAAGFLEHLDDRVALDPFQQGEVGVAASPRRPPWPG